MENKQHILLEKLDEFVRKYYKNKLVKGVIYSFTILFLFFLSFILLEYFGNFDSSLRKTLFFGFIVVSGITLVRYIAIPLFKLYRLGKFIDYSTAATIIGTHFGEVKDKLLNTLQLIKIGEASDNQLIASSINQRIEELKPVPFSKAIDISRNKKHLKYASIPLVIFLAILFINAQIIKDGAERIVNYSKEYIPEAPFQFNLMNESMDVVENEDFELKIKLTGTEIPNEVFLNLNKKSIKLRKKSNTEFSYAFSNIQEKKSFQLFAAGFNSETYEITEKEAAGLFPAVKGLQVGIVTQLQDDPIGEVKPIMKDVISIKSRQTFEFNKNRTAFRLSMLGNEIKVPKRTMNRKIDMAIISLFLLYPNSK